MSDKSKKRDWTYTIELIFPMLILGWGLLILLLSIFTTSIKLDLGWMAVLAGVGFLSIDTVRITLQNWQNTRGIDIAPSAGLITIGLGAITKEPWLSSFFYGVAILTGILYLVKIFRTKA